MMSFKVQKAKTNRTINIQYGEDFKMPFSVIGRSKKFIPKDIEKISKTINQQEITDITQHCSQ